MRYCHESRISRCPFSYPLRQHWQLDPPYRDFLFSFPSLSRFYAGSHLPYNPKSLARLRWRKLTSPDSTPRHRKLTPHLLAIG